LKGLAGGPLGDGGLTEEGREQSRALARRLSITGELASASAFYTSTLPRAVETGEIVFSAINAALVPTQDAALAELAVGEADGLTWAEIKARYDLPDWNVDPTQVNVPGGESLITFYERCVSAIDRLSRRGCGYSFTAEDRTLLNDRD
jgi:ribonuclease H / adenosylcobalamin/alpha-ribazole phosphatase